MNSINKYYHFSYFFHSSINYNSYHPSISNKYSFYYPSNSNSNSDSNSDSDSNSNSDSNSDSPSFDNYCSLDLIPPSDPN